MLDRCRADPCTLDDVVADLGLPITEAAMTLARLERSGWVREAGGWFEAVVPCPDARLTASLGARPGVSASDEVHRIPSTQCPMLSPSRPTSRRRGGSSRSRSR